MAKFTKRIVLVLWVMILCIGMLGVTAYAANDPVSAIIEVNTALSGDSPDTPDTFRVELTADQAGNPMPQGAQNGVYTMSLQGQAAGKIRMDFDRVGQYSYTVKQLSNNDPNCYQDTGVYHMTVYVTYTDQAGKLYVSVVLTRQGVEDKQEKILFSNHYAAAAEVSMGATVTLDGKTPANNAFSFVLKDENGKVLQTVKNSSANVVFAPIAYDRIGTYTYTIAEVTGEDSKILYDKNLYTAVVTVTKEADGDYQAHVVYKLADKKLEGKPAFVNKTKAATPQTGDTFPVFLVVAVMLVSLAAVVILLLSRKRKKAE